MKLRCLTSLVALLFLSSCFNRPELPDYTSREEIDDELYMVRKIWRNDGEVIVGLIDPLPEGNISSRTPVREGRFTAAVAGGRSLTFYAHGYDPLRINGTNRLTEEIVDAGKVSFRKTSAKHLRRWEATIRPIEGNPELKATLLIKNQDYLFKDHGYSGGSWPTIEVDQKFLQPGGLLEFDGLSQIPYYVSLSGPGLVTKTLKVGRGGRGVIKAGSITLLQAPQFDFTYRVRVRKKGGDWQEDLVNTETVVCDGDSQLLFSDARDNMGSSMNLRLKPTDEGVVASFFYYGKENFVELGTDFDLENTHWDGVNRSNAAADVILKNGEFYLFQKLNSSRGLDVELLFGVQE